MHRALITILVFQLFLLFPALAAGRSSKDEITASRHNYISNYVWALSLENACQKWRLDRLRAMVARNLFSVGDNDFDEGGRLHAEFMEEARKAKKIVGAMDGDLACDTAKMMYGPDGQVVKDWMTLR